MTAADRLREGQRRRAERHEEEAFRAWYQSHCCACRNEVSENMLAVSNTGSVCELCARDAVAAFDRAAQAVERLMADGI